MASNILIVTNGDSAAELIRSVVQNATVLPWNDVLHDGPVPDLDLHSLSKVRADYISDCGWGNERTSIYQQFERRDETLSGYRDYDEVVLFFEHDLYDQLQLCQLLDYFHSVNRNNVSLSMVVMSDYIAEQSAGTIAMKYNDRRPVEEQQLLVGSSFWRIFTSRNHQPLVGFDCSALAMLGSARTRLLEEYPSLHSGLPRSRRAIVDILLEGSRDPVDLFRAHQELEHARYLGDSSFWTYLEEMIDCTVPVIECQPVFFRPGHGSGFRSLRLSLTISGAGIAQGECDDVEMNGIDRWLGGVHMVAERCPRWDGSVLHTADLER